MIRGNVTDRPWGKTLGTLARRGVTGQLTVRNHNAKFEIAFHHGLVVAAASSGSAESATALAFRQGLITAGQVSSIPFGAANDWELLARLLPPQDIVRLQRQAIAACVARSFVFADGELTLDAEITLRVVPQLAMHVGGMIFHGARMFLGEQRLRAGVHALGSRFTTAQGADVRCFGLSARDQVIADIVLQGTSASLLDAIGDAEERRTARAAVYAFVSCGAMQGEGPAIPASAPVRKAARLAPGRTQRELR